MSYKVYCATDGCKMEPQSGLIWEEATAAQDEHLRKKPKHDVRVKAER